MESKIMDILGVPHEVVMHLLYYMHDCEPAQRLGLASRCLLNWLDSNGSYWALKFQESGFDIRAFAAPTQSSKRRFVMARTALLNLESDYDFNGVYTVYESPVRNVRYSRQQGASQSVILSQQMSLDFSHWPDYKLVKTDTVTEYERVPPFPSSQLWDCFGADDSRYNRICFVGCSTNGAQNCVSCVYNVDTDSWSELLEFVGMPRSAASTSFVFSGVHLFFRTMDKFAIGQFELGSPRCRLLFKGDFPVGCQSFPVVSFTSEYLFLYYHVPCHNKRDGARLLKVHLEALHNVRIVGEGCQACETIVLPATSQYAVFCSLTAFASLAVIVHRAGGIIVDLQRNKVVRTFHCSGDIISIGFIDSTMFAVFTPRSVYVVDMLSRRQIIPTVVPELEMVCINSVTGQISISRCAVNEILREVDDILFRPSTTITAFHLELFGVKEKVFVAFRRSTPASTKDSSATKATFHEVETCVYISYLKFHDMKCRDAFHDMPEPSVKQVDPRRRQHAQDKPAAFEEGPDIVFFKIEYEDSAYVNSPLKKWSGEQVQALLPIVLDAVESEKQRFEQKARSNAKK